MITWYANGEREPWRCAVEIGNGHVIDERCAATFSDLLIALGETWAEVMPEPVV